jgi:phage terminase large subunit GpA-like protein
MNQAIADELIQTFTDGFQMPYTGSLIEWARENVILPDAYAIPGSLDLSTSPYLIEPSKALLDGKYRMVNLIASTQTGKTMLGNEVFIPWIIAENPGSVMKLHQNDDVAETFIETRLSPLLHNCKPLVPYLAFKRYSVKKRGIVLPHMAVKVSGAHENISHGFSIRYLLMDETHLYSVGLVEKFIARTTAFAGRRKIVITSQPNQHGSELEKYYNLGWIYEWQWVCPSCKKVQPWYWSKQRNDLTYAGINWETILMKDNETTDIAKSAATAWLECFHCKHKIEDNITNRRMLNESGEYVCIKNDGDPEVVSFTWPGFVNINLSFASFVVQYINAKRIQRNTGLNEDLVTFVTQCLGKFYKAEPMSDVSKILLGEYETNPDKIDDTAVRFMGVDCQRKGLVKYYIIREYDRNGNESRRLDYGICRTFEEVETLANKWKVKIPCVAIDEGDGEQCAAIRQECVKRNQVIKRPDGLLDIITWCPMKGSDKLSFLHPDKTTRYYASPGKGDCMFPQDHKLRGIPAPFVLWSNYSIKTILANLRDQKVPGVRWLVNKKDPEYEKQIYSEGLQSVIDKKTGMVVTRWMQVGTDNHWWDAECMCLVQAIRAGVFSATKVNEDELRKIVEDKTPLEVKKAS